MRAIAKRVVWPWRFLTRHAGLAGAAVALCGPLATGCSGDASRPAAAGTDSQDRRTPWQKHYSLPVVARSADGTLTTLAELSPFPAAVGVVSVGSGGQRTLQESAPVACGEIGAVDTIAHFEAQVVAGVCGGVLSENDFETVRFQTLASPRVPWPGYGSEYIWGSPASCDTELARMDFLLCAADTMMQWADATTDLTFPASDADIILPPLPADSRFVPRDLATYYLSQLPRMEATGKSGNPCGLLVAALGNIPSYSGDVVGHQDLTDVGGSFAYRDAETSAAEALVYSTPGGPTQGVAAFARWIAKDRALARVHILRAGSRLLEKAVHDTLQSDRALAQRSMSRAGDPTVGAERFWGVRATGDTESGVDDTVASGGDSVDPYNSMAHAFSYFYGRWERRGERDFCGLGETHPSLMLASCLPNVGSRIMARPPRTSGGRRAVQLLGEAGVFAIQPSAGSQRDVLAKLLSERRGVEVSEIAPSLGAITDGELAQALKYVERSAAVGGIHDWNSALTDVGPGLGGARTRADLAVVAMDATNALDAEMGGLALAASSAVRDQSGWQAQELFNAGAQNLSLMAQSFARAIGLSLPGGYGLSIVSDPEVRDVADKSVSEILAWAGPGWVTSYSMGEGAERALQVGTSGLESVVGALREADGGPALRLFHGVPAAAECAAGVRTSCTGIDPGDIFAPMYESVSNGPSGLGAVPGSQRNLTFDAGDHSWDIGAEASDFYTSNWLIQLPQNGQPGRVLTALRFADEPYDVSSFSVSRLQDEMSRMDFAIPLYEKCAFRGDCTIQTPDNYCLSDRSGIPYPQDLFVPLENELTSNGDQFENSWRHYLDRAKEAAERADALGQSKFSTAEEQQTHREEAQQKLADLCGLHGNPDDITFVGHKLDLSVADPVLQACLDPRVYDRAYLGKCPSGAPGQCPCATPAAQNPGAACFTELELVDAGEGPGTVSCTAMAKATHSLWTTSPWEDELDAMLTEPTSQPAAILSLLATLQFEDRLTSVGGQDRIAWSVSRQGQAIMDSLDPQLWPGCEASGACSTVPQSAEFRDAFGGQWGGDSGASIRWRVLGAIHELAEAVGRARAGLFKLYVPQLTDPAVDGSVFTMFPLAPALAAGDASILAGASPTVGVPPGYLPTDGSWLPPWLERVRQTPEAYRLLLATSVARGESYPVHGLGLFPHGACSEPPVALSPDQRSLENWAVIPCDHHQLIYFQAIGEVPGFPAVANPSMVFRGVFLPTLNDTLGRPDSFWDFDAVSLANSGIPKFPSSEAEKLHGGFVGPYSFPLLGTQCLKNDGGAGPDVFGRLSCVQNDVVHDYWAEFGNRLLRPTLCSPSERVEAWANPVVEGTSCDASKRRATAAFLACAATNSSQVDFGVGIPPLVTDRQGFTELRQWLASEAVRIRQEVGKFYLANLPMGVAEDIRSKAASPDTKLGAVGAERTALVVHSDDLRQRWLDLARQLESMGEQVETAGNVVDQVEVGRRAEALKMAIRRVERWRGVAAAVGGLVGSIGLKSDLQVMGAAINAASALVAAAAVDTYELKVSAVEDELKDLQIYGQLIKLNGEVADGINQMNQTMIAIRSDATSMVGNIARIKQLQNDGRYQAAVVAGVDFFYDQDGKKINITSNAVSGHLYDVQSIRYEEATSQAKYLSYVARRAIEQRLLVKLGDMDESVGPLEAPSSWVDDICSMRGIRYEDYSGSIKTPRGEAAVEHYFDKVFHRSADLLAKEFVGDYVAKLETFVNQYNVSSPSHEGDDQVVVSLRDDAAGVPGPCTEIARNLLVRSTGIFPTGGPGWKINPCRSGSCLHAQPAEGLPATAGTTPAPTDVTWLHGVSTSGPAEPGDGSPGASVWQEVGVGAGPHVLSFWAQSRAADGAQAMVPSTVYVGFYDEAWQPITIAPLEAPVGGDIDGLGWPGRLSVPVEFPGAGQVRVVLSVAGPEGSLGSVLIASPQLEPVGLAGGQPTEYQSTGESRELVSLACSTQSAASLRSSFDRTCEGDGCVYSFARPIQIDTRHLENAFGVSRRLAAGNFNYRHLSLALNLVGSGVLDCSREGTNCYGDSSVEFDLEHDGFDLPLVDYDFREHRFNFGSAAIHHAKALAAERVLTTPISGSDQSLISQLGIEKQEFSGRPLDGTYRLKIWDRPALVWSRVEDVQLVLKYRYWSRIDSAPGGN
jgi:hypothetical protein